VSLHPGDLWLHCSVPDPAQGNAAVRELTERIDALAAAPR